jgi:DNA-binding phage protein
MNNTVNYKDRLFKKLQDPVEAQAYLHAALEDEDPEVLLLALQDVITAYERIV